MREFLNGLLIVLVFLAIILILAKHDIDLMAECMADGKKRYQCEAIINRRSTVILEDNR